MATSRPQWTSQDLLVLGLTRAIVLKHPHVFAKGVRFFEVGYGKAQYRKRLASQMRKLKREGVPSSEMPERDTSPRERLMDAAIFLCRMGNSELWLATMAEEYAAAFALMVWILTDNNADKSDAYSFEFQSLPWDEGATYREHFWQGRAMVANAVVHKRMIRTASASVLRLAHAIKGDEAHEFFRLAAGGFAAVAEEGSRHVEPRLPAQSDTELKKLAEVGDWSITLKSMQTALLLGGKHWAAKRNLVLPRPELMNGNVPWYKVSDLLAALERAKPPEHKSPFGEYPISPEFLRVAKRPGQQDQTRSAPKLAKN